jgi:hypothetical protein
MLRLELPNQEVYFHNGQKYVEMQKFKFGKTNLFEEDEYLYTGYVLNNKPHFKGIIYRLNGDKHEIMYDGEMQDGQIAGHGAYYLEGEMLRFLGTFDSNGFFQGQGSIYYQGVMISNGLYKNGLIQSGTYSQPKSDATLIGNFTYEENGFTPFLTGKGMVKYRDGSYCVGNYVKNLFHGSCVIYDTSGNLYERLIASKLIKQDYEKKSATYHVHCHNGCITRIDKYEYSDYMLESLAYLEEKIPEKFDDSLKPQDIYKKTDKDGNVSYIIIPKTFILNHPQKLIQL